MSEGKGESGRQMSLVSEAENQSVSLYGADPATNTSHYRRRRDP